MDVRCSAMFVSSVLCYAENFDPPPNPYISEMAFSCRFQKVYTNPPTPP